MTSCGYHYDAGKLNWKYDPEEFVLKLMSESKLGKIEVNYVWVGLVVELQRCVKNSMVQRKLDE